MWLSASKLHGPLRPWAEHLLDTRHLREQGWFDVRHGRRLWHEQIEGRREWMYLRWDVLMLQAWTEQR